MIIIVVVIMIIIYVVAAIIIIIIFIIIRSIIIITFLPSMHREVRNDYLNRLMGAILSQKGQFDPKS